MDDHGQLIDLLKYLRAARGQPSLRSIALRSSLSSGYVTEIFNARKLPTVKTAEALARGLKASPGEADRIRALADGAVRDRGSKGGAELRRDRPRIRSAYLRQVARIAPEELRGRDEELAELRHFCTSGGGESYAWWHGPAWAGKSALMSWFVLYPPPAVRIVSFFVTGRLASQNDLQAFINAVSEQLAEIIDEPIPTHATETTREAYLLESLARGARHCQRKNQRLVLVIDGLDEDEGIGEHSIAALLPVRPEFGMRLIVTSRLGRSLPADVPPEHPLRRRDAARLCAVSEFASVVRADMERELDRLLEGSQTQKDLLGFVVASQGGLSKTDLSELTGASPRQVDKQLIGVAGRTFARRKGQWSAADGSPLYFLGHEEIRISAIEFLGAERISQYRKRLRDWAETYTARGWPAGSPEYLLRDYPKSLLEIGELDEAVGFVTDQSRHERMLDISGGDRAALSEIDSAIDAVALNRYPDLFVMMRLVIARSKLHQRNAHVPVGLPAVWACLGNQTRAESLARCVGKVREQALALAAVAEVFADTDLGYAQQLLRQAETCAGKIALAHVRLKVFAAIFEAWLVVGSPHEARSLLLPAREAARSVQVGLMAEEAAVILARMLANIGQPVDAEDIAFAITEPDLRCLAFCAIASARVGAGWPERAQSIIDQAKAEIPSISHAGRRSRAIGELALAIARRGDVHEARSVVSTIDDRYWQTRATAELSGIALESGMERQADLLATECVVMARSIEAPFDRAWAACSAASALARVGRSTEAAELAEFAETPDHHAEVLSGVAMSLARQGDNSAASRIAQQAEALARVVVDRVDLSWVATDLAMTLAANEQLELAELLAWSNLINPHQHPHATELVVYAAAISGNTHWALARIEAISEERRRVWATAAVAAALAELGDIGAAETLAYSIQDHFLRADSLSAVAEKVARLGDRAHAAALADDAANALELMDADVAMQRSAGSEFLESARGDWAKGSVLLALAAAGQLNIASALMRSLPDTLTKLRAFAFAAETLVLAGHAEDDIQQLVQGFAREDLRDWANAVLQEMRDGAPDFIDARVLMKSLAQTDQNARMVIIFAATAEAAHQAGDFEQCLEALERAEGLLSEIGDVAARVQAAKALTAALGRAHLFGRAEQVVRSFSAIDQARDRAALAQVAGIPNASDYIAAALYENGWQAIVGVLGRAEPNVLAIVAQQMLDDMDPSYFPDDGGAVTVRLNCDSPRMLATQGFGGTLFTRHGTPDEMLLFEPVAS